MGKKEAYKFTAEDAENYDRYLGPVLFEPYGQYLASQIDTTGITSVLELASGTGRVTGHIRAALPAGISLTATDLSADMLSIAKRRLGEDGIIYQEEDIQKLSFADNSFDLVICQFGMMFLPDKQQGFNEIGRVLKPGGKLICFTWDSTQKNTIFNLLVNELMLPYFADEDPSRLFVPFAMHQPQQLAAWLKNAGFESATTQTIALNTGIASAGHIHIGFYKIHPLGKAMKDKDAEGYNIVGEKFRAELERRYGHQVSVPQSALLTIGQK